MKLLASASVILAACFTAAPAMAQGTFVRLGVTHIDMADKGKVFVNGMRDPAADYQTDKDFAGFVEIGHFVVPGIAVRLSGTTPTETYNLPRGSLDGTPNLGNDTSSTFTLTATFHPLQGQRFSPYIGGGIGLNKIWSTEDRLATDLEIGDSHGPVIQAGVEFDVSERFGVFFDAKKGFWSADASGFLGPARVTAEAELDPVLLSAGALIRF